MTTSPPDDDRGSTLFSIRVLAVLVLALPPLWVILRVMPAGPRVARIVRMWARGIVRMSGCPLRVSGTEHLHDVPCAVLVANHSSYLDSVVLLAAVPTDCRFVANHLAADRPLVGLVIRKSGHLVVNRTSWRSRADCSRAMTDLLRRGTSLLVFPEGGRADTLSAFRAGAFRAAVRTGRPIVPIAISGTRSILPRRFRLLRPAPIDVWILEAIERREGARHDASRLAAAAMTAIAAHLTHPATGAPA